MRPNHHWAVHIPEQISLYSPLNGFWAFLTERLNKILKNLNSNNWTGGRLEVSMMREFHRSTRIDSVVCGTRPHSHASSTDLSVASSVKSHRSLFNVTRRRNLKGTLFNLSWVKPIMPRPLVPFKMQLMQVCCGGTVSWHGRFTGSQTHKEARVFSPEALPRIPCILMKKTYCVWDCSNTTTGRSRQSILHSIKLSGLRCSLQLLSCIILHYSMVNGLHQPSVHDAILRAHHSSNFDMRVKPLLGKFVKSYDTFNQEFPRPKMSSWFTSRG